MLNLLGFFEEFGSPAHGDAASVSAVTLQAARREVAEPDEERLVEYLDSGYLVLPLMEGCPDVLSGAVHRRSGGGSSHLTDGAWLWRQDLAYYVEQYHVELPSAFLEHVRSNKYTLPVVRTVDFRVAYQEILPLFGWSPRWDNQATFLD
jgi:hypothetical protein